MTPAEQAAQLMAQAKQQAEWAVRIMEEAGFGPHVLGRLDMVPAAIEQVINDLARIVEADDMVDPQYGIVHGGKTYATLGDAIEDRNPIQERPLQEDVPLDRDFS